MKVVSMAMIKMSMHDVHFITGESKIFYDIITMPDWDYFKGYSDCGKNHQVCIPKTSVLYVEMRH